VLPMAPAILSRLAAFGLDCLGAVAALAPADLQRQFGSDGLHLARLVRGDDSDGLQPEAPVRAWSERLVLDGGVGDLEVLASAVRRCALELGRRLAEGGLAAAEIGLTLEQEEREPLAAGGTAPAPVESPDTTWTAALSLLTTLRPAAPVTAVAVEVRTLSPAGGRQTDLLRAGDATRDGVLSTAMRLRSRFGEVAVRRPRLALDPGDLPERRFTWETPVLAAGTSP